MRDFLVIILLVASVLSAESQITIVSYNTENFFNPAVDSLNPDLAYTPSGSYHWTYSRFNRKSEQIARVIASVMSDSFPDLVVLNEVEDSICLVRLCRKMPHYPYRFIHYDGIDKRGIDVAMLYDTTRLKPIQSCPLRVNLPQTVTRDILYASFLVGMSDTLHLFACHLPSQLGGYAASQSNRDLVKAFLHHATDSILAHSPSAKIVVCGDMNMPPKDDLTPLHNLMLSFKKKNVGTHKFRGIWTCLDQFYVSERLLSGSNVRIFDAPWLLEEDRRYLSTRPKRTFIHIRYNRNGFSDHLPIVLKISL